MLVLSRKVNESIRIDGNIRIKVIAIHSKTVHLSIETPPSVGIYREKILPGWTTEVVLTSRWINSSPESRYRDRGPDGPPR